MNKIHSDRFFNDLDKLQSYEDPFGESMDISKTFINKVKNFLLEVELEKLEIYSVVEAPHPRKIRIVWCKRWKKTIQFEFSYNYIHYYVFNNFGAYSNGELTYENTKEFLALINFN